jgi:hypothetical protein
VALEWVGGVVYLPFFFRHFGFCCLVDGLGGMGGTLAGASATALFLLRCVGGCADFGNYFGDLCIQISNFFDAKMIPPSIFELKIGFSIIFTLKNSLKLIKKNNIELS